MSDDEKTRVLPDIPGTLVGQRLSGIYQLDQRIAAGGMGEVFRGHNIETGDTVAIKIVLPELAQDPTILSLFRKEGSILSHLSHDAIVRYHVFTIDQTIGRPYLAMEFVDGDSLIDVMGRGPLAAESVRRLCYQLASGLSAVHEAGAVHRDLSPDNIILPGGKVERAKIIDFGIARSNAQGGETLIGSGFAGKYNYVSPEQLGMFEGKVSAQSDIYSLGLILAAALNGAPTDMSGSQYEVLEKRRTVPPLPKTDDDLHAMLTAMLQPNPQDRPASMAEIAEMVFAGVSTDPASGKQLHTAGTGRPPLRHESPFGPIAGEANRSSGATSPGMPAGTAQAAARFAGRRPGRTTVAVAGLATVLLAGAAIGWFIMGEAKEPGDTALTEPETAAAERNAGNTPDASARPEAPPPASAEPASKPEPKVAVAPSTTTAGTPPAPQPAPQFRSRPPQRHEAGIAPTTAGSAPAAVDRPAPANSGESVATASPTVPTRLEPEKPIAPTLPPADRPASETTVVAGGAIRPTPAKKIAELAERVSWLRSYASGVCQYATITDATDQEIDIEGFGRTAEPFERMSIAFERKFHLDPNIEVRPIAAAQCEVTDLLRTLEASDAERPQLTLDTTSVANDAQLSGVLATAGGLHANLLLIDHDGNAVSLNPYLKAGGGQATFRLPIGLTEADRARHKPMPQLIVAITGPADLASTELSAPTPAATLVPKILAEIHEKGLGYAATAKFFRLGGDKP